MGNPARFSALNTKLKAMSARLLSQSDYDQLLTLATEKEVARYLQSNTRYQAVFGKEVSIENLKRWEIELLIQKQIILELNKIRNFLDDKYRGFIDLILLRYEIKDLKLVLRSISRNEDRKDLREHFVHDQSREVIPFDKLISQNNINDAATLFKGTIFQDAFRSMTEEDINLREFHLEMNLDATYYKWILGKAKKMENEDQRIMEEFLRTNIDLINIQWIWRAQKYYQLMDEEMLNYTLLGGNISFKKLKNIIYSQDSLEQIHQIGERYGLRFNDDEDEFLQTKINRLLQKTIVRITKEYPMSIAELLLYVHQLEFETMDIISIIEGVRYQFEDIKRLLIERGE